MKKSEIEDKAKHYAWSSKFPFDMADAEMAGFIAGFEYAQSLFPEFTRLMPEKEPHVELRVSSDLVDEFPDERLNECAFCAEIYRVEEHCLCEKCRKILLIDKSNKERIANMIKIGETGWI